MSSSSQIPTSGAAFVTGDLAGVFGGMADVHIDGHDNTHDDIAHSAEATTGPAASQQTEDSVAAAVSAIEAAADTNTINAADGSDDLKEKQDRTEHESTAEATAEQQGKPARSVGTTGRHGQWPRAGCRGQHEPRRLLCPRRGHVRSFLPAQTGQEEVPPVRAGIKAGQRLVSAIYLPINTNTNQCVIWLLRTAGKFFGFVLPSCL